MDYRGRGRSDYANDWKTYHPLQELADAILLLDRLAIDRVAVIGTSRGGIIAMLMASLHADRLAGALLNDIGPRIDIAGLLRLANTVGRADTFKSWDAAIDALKRTSPGFESLSEREWRDFAARLFRETPAGIRYDYDARLVQGLPPTPADADALPELWTLLRRFGPEADGRAARRAFRFPIGGNGRPHEGHASKTHCGDGRGSRPRSVPR